MPTSPRTASFSFTTASTPASATTAESSGTPAGQLNLSATGFKFGSTPTTDTTKVSQLLNALLLNRNVRKFIFFFHPDSN